MRCDFQAKGQRCEGEAKWEGLLQVMNPTDELPDGVQVKVKVCGHHSFSWSSLWGCWPITEEAMLEAEAFEADRQSASEARLDEIAEQCGVEASDIIMIDGVPCIDGMPADQWYEAMYEL